MIPQVTLIRAGNPGPMTLDGTNTWVLAGAGIRLVIDPGPLEEAHLRRVAEVGPVDVILLTHRHADHAEGAPRLAELTGAPVLDRAGLPDGEFVGCVQVLHTPGHTADSVSFLLAGKPAGDPAHNAAGTHAGDLPAGAPAVLTGDTILGRGSTVVAHPDGDLRAYLSSLRRLADLGDIAVLPGHGPALPSVAAAAGQYLTHRAARLEQVRAALTAGDRSAGDVVRRVYADVDPALWPAAEMSVRAQLAYLDETA